VEFAFCGCALLVAQKRPCTIARNEEIRKHVPGRAHAVSLRLRSPRPGPTNSAGGQPVDLKATDDRVNLFVLGYCPTPVSDAVCGLPPPLSATLSMPLRVPVAVGLNCKVTVQLPPPASEVPQVFPESR
jgi:hypothetical protein